MDKNQLDKQIAAWLIGAIKNKLSNTHDLIEVLIPSSNFSKLPNKVIKGLADYSSWDFKSDVLAILKNKANDNVEFILVNRSLSSISLREIGELYCYSKILNPIASLLISPNGVSNEVNILLLENNIKRDLLYYSGDKNINIISWNEKKNDIDYESVIPSDSLLL